ncbi:MAG: beta-L-arabinofuranosidase domain-containing protein [Phycisphaeraceae bacterium]
MPPSTTTATAPSFLVDVPRGADVPQPVVIGCPFAQGELTDASRFVLHGPTGKLPCAVHPFVHWPDGSTRWAQLAFTATEPGTYTLEPNGDAPAPDKPAWIERTDSGMRFGNDRLRIALTRSAPGPIASIEFDGRPCIRGPRDVQFFVDQASSLNGRVESIDVLEDSPVRVRVRVTGDHRDELDARRLSFRLDLEVWAGVPTLRMDYQFFNLEPGAPALSIESMHAMIRPALGDSPRQHFYQKNHGLSMRPRSVHTDRRVEILGDWSRNVPYVAERAMLEDGMEYPEYLEVSLKQSDEWIGQTGDGGAMYLGLPEMVKLRPKRLIGERGALIADLWPRDAGPLRVPQGRSRRHTLTLAFCDATPDFGQVKQLLDAPLYEGRATPDPARLRALGEFDQDRTLELGHNFRLDERLGAVTKNVKLGTGMFDYGDGKESGYFVNYVAIAKQPLRPGAEPCDNALRPDCPDALRPADPARYEPVWANNEYDLINGLCIELTRANRRDLWPTLRAMVRHNIEVDFVHYSDDPWQHHGTPAHSAHHNHASAYPSHIWTQGLMQYYCLTGDPDVLEVAVKLGDTIIRNLEDEQRGPLMWGFNREIGWPLLALSCLYEVTREARFGDYAGRIANFLAGYDREAQATPVKLSNVDPLDDIHAQIVGSFFGYASMVEGMDHYSRLTERDDLKAWLRDFLNKLHAAAAHRVRSGRGSHFMLPQGMAIGYELTGERKFLEMGMLSLESWLRAWGGAPTEVKAAATTYRGVVRFLHHAEEAGLLTAFDYQYASAARGEA